MLGRNNEVSRENHGKIIHSGSFLSRNLPAGLGDALRGDIGIAAAEAAVEFMPEWLSTIVDLARALRFARRPDDACKEMMHGLGKRTEAVDFDEVIRGYYYEWSTCAGNLGTRQGSIVDVWVATYSLSDSLRPNVTLENAKLSCAGLGVAFERLVSGEADGAFAKGRRAATEIGWQTNPDQKTSGYFSRYERELNSLGVPTSADNDNALAWLSAAALAAWQKLEDPALRNLQSDGRLTFKKLREILPRNR